MKDNQYWKDYNQKRREYNRLKQQEYRKRIKEVADISKVADTKITNPVNSVADGVEQIIVADTKLGQVADRIKVADNSASRSVADSQPKEKVADRMEKQTMVADKVADQKLWSNYYNSKKPYCSGCIKKGISADQYAFCSLAKDTDPDFKNVYVCQVYHWTIFQGQGKT